MVFNIYDETLTRVGEISTVLSSTWQEKFCDRGICQLVVSDSAAAASILQVGRFVGKSDKKTLWQIKTREKKDGELWCNGYTANYTLLNDRVFEGLHKSDIVETDLRDAVMTSRPAGIVGLSDLRGLSGAVVSEHTYPTLFKLAKDLCGSVNYGFRFIHDKSSHKLLLDVYPGEEVPNAKFSQSFGNLSNLVLQASDSEYFNVAYVGGAGQGEERTFIVCGATSSEGLQRHEMFVDARDLQKEDGQSTEDYTALLQQRGLEKLNEKLQIMTVSFDVDPADFGKLYGLGDTIRCVIHEEGLSLFVRVVAFEETIEKNKTELQITIGTPVLQTIGGGY